MLITKTTFFVSTHFIVFFIGYLLASDFRRHQGLLRHLMNQNNPPHRRENSVRHFAKILCAQEDEMYSSFGERHRKEFGFHVCQTKNVTSTIKCTCTDHSKLRHKIIFIPKFQQNFNSDGNFPLPNKKNSFPCYNSVADSSRLKTIVKHKVPFPLIATNFREIFSNNESVVLEHDGHSKYPSSKYVMNVRDDDTLLPSLRRLPYKVHHCIFLCENVRELCVDNFYFENEENLKIKELFFSNLRNSTPFQRDLTRDTKGIEKIAKHERFYKSYSSKIQDENIDPEQRENRFLNDQYRISKYISYVDKIETDNKDIMKLIIMGQTWTSPLNHSPKNSGLHSKNVRNKRHDLKRKKIDDNSNYDGSYQRVKNNSMKEGFSDFLFRKSSHGKKRNKRLPIFDADDNLNSDYKLKNSFDFSISNDFYNITGDFKNMSGVISLGAAVDLDSNISSSVTKETKNVFNFSLNQNTRIEPHVANNTKISMNESIYNSSYQNGVLKEYPKENPLIENVLFPTHENFLNETDINTHITSNLTSIGLKNETQEISQTEDTPNNNTEFFDYLHNQSSYNRDNSYNVTEYSSKQYTVPSQIAPNTPLVLKPNTISNFIFSTFYSEEYASRLPKETETYSVDTSTAGSITSPVVPYLDGISSSHTSDDENLISADTERINNYDNYTENFKDESVLPIDQIHRNLSYSNSSYSKEFSTENENESEVMALDDSSTEDSNSSDSTGKNLNKNDFRTNEYGSSIYIEKTTPYNTRTKSKPKENTHYPETTDFSDDEFDTLNDISDSEMDENSEVSSSFHTWYNRLNTELEITHSPTGFVQANSFASGKNSKNEPWTQNDELTNFPSSSANHEDLNIQNEGYRILTTRSNNDEKSLTKKYIVITENSDGSNNDQFASMINKFDEKNAITSGFTNRELSDSKSEFFTDEFSSAETNYDGEKLSIGGETIPNLNTFNIISEAEAVTKELKMTENVISSVRTERDLSISTDDAVNLSEKNLFSTVDSPFKISLVNTEKSKLEGTPRIFPDNIQVKKTEDNKPFTKMHQTYVPTDNLLQIPVKNTAFTDLFDQEFSSNKEISSPETTYKIADDTTDSVSKMSDIFTRGSPFANSFPIPETTTNRNPLPNKEIRIPFETKPATITSYSSLETTHKIDLDTVDSVSKKSDIFTRGFSFANSFPISETITNKNPLPNKEIRISFETKSATITSDSSLETTREIGLDAVDSVSKKSDIFTRGSSFANSFPIPETTTNINPLPNKEIRIPFETKPATITSDSYNYISTNSNKEFPSSINIPVGTEDVDLANKDVTDTEKKITEDEANYYSSTVSDTDSSDYQKIYSTSELITFDFPNIIHQSESIDILGNTSELAIENTGENRNEVKPPTEAVIESHRTESRLLSTIDEEFTSKGNNFEINVSNEPNKKTVNNYITENAKDISTIISEPERSSAIITTTNDEDIYSSELQRTNWNADEMGSTKMIRAESTLDNFSTNEDYKISLDEMPPEGAIKLPLSTAEDNEIIKIDNSLNGEIITRPPKERVSINQETINIQTDDVSATIKNALNSTEEKVSLRDIYSTVQNNIVTYPPKDGISVQNGTIFYPDNLLNTATDVVRNEATDIAKKEPSSVESSILVKFNNSIKSSIDGTLSHNSTISFVSSEASVTADAADSSDSEIVTNLEKDFTSSTDGSLLKENKKITSSTDGISVNSEGIFLSSMKSLPSANDENTESLQDNSKITSVTEFLSSNSLSKDSFTPEITKNGDLSETSKEINSVSYTSILVPEFENTNEVTEKFLVSSEKELLSSSDIGITFVDDEANVSNDEILIRTDRDVISSNEDNIFPSNEANSNENGVSNQDGETTYPENDINRTEKQIFPVKENEASVQSDISVTGDISLTNDLPQLPTLTTKTIKVIKPNAFSINGLNTEIEVSTPEMNINPLDGDSDDEINIDVSTETYPKSSSQIIPFSAKLNTDTSPQISPETTNMNAYASSQAVSFSAKMNTDSTSQDTLSSVYMNSNSEINTAENTDGIDLSTENSATSGKTSTNPQISSSSVASTAAFKPKTAEISSATEEEIKISSQVDDDATISKATTEATDDEYENNNKKDLKSTEQTAQPTASSEKTTESTTSTTLQTTTRLQSSSTKESTSSTRSTSETTAQPTESSPIPFHFTIDADYDEVVGARKSEFETSLAKQLVVVMRVPSECLQNMRVSKGSIEVNFDLVPNSGYGHMADENALKAAADELKRKIDNGQLNINDLNGNTLIIVPMDPPTKAPLVNATEHTTLILGVVIGAFILTVISVAVAAIIIKRKANKGGSRLTPIEEVRSKLPSYREIPFQEALFMKGSERNKLMLGKYCYNTGRWLGPGPEPTPYRPPDSVMYRPPTDSEIRKTPRPPTVVFEPRMRVQNGGQEPSIDQHQTEKSCRTIVKRIKKKG